MTFETFDQRDEETWPDQWPTKRPWQGHEKHNDKYIYRTPSKTAPRDLWPLRFLIRVMRRYNLTNKKRMTKTITMKKTKTMRIEEHPQRAIVETCDLWETDYIFGNWEQQSQHSQWPLNKEWQGQHSQFLRCFSYFFCFVKVYSN